MLDAAIGIDAAGVVQLFNRAAETIFGFSREDIIGEEMAELLIPQEYRERHWAGFRRLVEGGSSRILGRRVEVAGLRSDGTEFPAELTIRHVSEEPALWMAFVRDLSERQARERELKHLVHDNEMLLTSIGDGILRLSTDGLITYANPAAGGLLGFSSEELLGQHAHSLMHHSHEDGSVYRVEECPVYGALRGEVCHVTTEVFWRRDGTHFAVDYTSAPIRDQDRIVGAVCCFADITAARQRERDLQERVRFGNEIHQALQEERFVLHGQPISPAADPQRPARHELLIRMKDLARPDVLKGPGEFLPQAERYGLINQIDRWVVSKALEEAGRRPVSLNLSAKSVAEPEITDLVLAGIQELAIPRGNLMLEITETTALENLAAAHRFIQRLTDIGCGIALDDFGTGYGTFAHLKELPVSHLKIDMTFVRNLTESTDDERVVRSIVSLARNFGMKTIAEGVETAAAMELLQRLGVDYLQGYHLGRPLPLERD